MQPYIVVHVAKEDRNEEGRKGNYRKFPLYTPCFPLPSLKLCYMARYVLQYVQRSSWKKAILSTLLQRTEITSCSSITELRKNTVY